MSDPVLSQVCVQPGLYNPACRYDAGSHEWLGGEDGEGGDAAVCYRCKPGA